MQHVVAGFINISQPHTQGLHGAPGVGAGGLLVFTEEGVSHVPERERVTRRRAERVNTVVE